MKRIDRLLGEARLMRILRAARAQGLVPTPADFDWFAEMGCVQALVADFAETDGLPAGGDERRREAIDVLASGAMAPFLKACVEAIANLYAEMAPQRAVSEATWARVCALISKKQDDQEEADAGRVRRSAVDDLAVLAVQMALFEVVRTAGCAFDLDRGLSPASDPASIVIEGGRARRMRRPRRILNADEIGLAALAGRTRPAPRLEPPKAQADDGDANLMTEAMRAVRKLRKERKAAKGGAAVASQ